MSPAAVSLGAAELLASGRDVNVTLCLCLPAAKYIKCEQCGNPKVGASGGGGSISNPFDATQKDESQFFIHSVIIIDGRPPSLYAGE